jgi:hypothetical protein
MTRPIRPNGWGRAPQRAILAALALSILVQAPGCATREVRETLLERANVKVVLREFRRGTHTLERGFEHPVQIAPTRLAHILGVVEIRGREEQLAGIRAVFEPAALPAVSDAVSYGLQRASPNQELAVSVITKKMQHGIFDRKYLTSFVTYVENDLLYLHISRVDWPIPDLVKKTANPEPRVNEHPMKFRVVPSEGMYQEEAYAVSVDWQDPVFARPLRSADAGRRERTILMEEPDLPASRAPGLPADVLSRLTAAQLRELADLEEARQQGRLTEGHYRRQRQLILDSAGDDGASSD